jgi:protein involved in polysaccharide export with SLBB domain
MSGLEVDESTMPAAYNAIGRRGQLDVSPLTNQGVTHIDLSNDAHKRMLARGVRLENGDIVSVEERKGKSIYVVGMVNKPGEYKIPPDHDLRVLEAIGLAGGVDNNTMPTKALLVRAPAHGSKSVAIGIDLYKAKRSLDENTQMMPGDTLSVEETAASYLRGVFRNALRFAIGVSPTLPGI